MYVLTFLFVLMVALYFIIQLPFVQNWAKNKATAFFQKEWNTNVEIEKFRLGFSDLLILEEVLIETPAGDTLLIAGEIKVSFRSNIFHLFRNKLNLSSVYLKDIQLYLERNNSGYNFSFITDYFKKDSKTGRSPAPFELDVNQVTLENIHFKHNDEVTQSFLESRLKIANFQFEAVDLGLLIFNINSAHISGSSTILEIREKKDEFIDKDTEEILEELIYTIITEEEDSTETSEALVKILISDFKFLNGAFYLKNLSTHNVRTVPDDAIDFDFLVLKSVNIHLEDFRMEDLDIHTVICQLQFNTDTGFSIENMTANEFILNENSLAINSFMIKTPKSIIQDSLSFKFQSLRDFNEFEDLIFMDIKLTNTDVTTSELFYFAPELRKNDFFSKNSNDKVTIEGRFRGRVNSLRGDDLNIVIGGKTSFLGNFGSRNLTEPSETILNLDITRLNSDIITLRQLLPGFNLPPHFNSLGKLQFTGRFDGFYEDFVTFGTIRSDLGVAIMDLQLNTLQGMHNARYRGRLDLVDFDLKRWLNNDDFGRLTLNTRVENGKGLILETVEANLAAELKQLQYKGYNYTNLEFEGKLVKNLIDGVLKAQDENMDLLFEGTIDFQGEYPVFNFQSAINKLDLYALNLISLPYSFAGDIDLQMEYKDISNIEGFARINDFVFLRKGGDYLHVEDIYLESRYKNVATKAFSFNSDILDLYLKGEFDLQHIYPTIVEIIEEKFPEFAKVLDLKGELEEIPNNDFTFDLDIHDTKNLMSILDVPLSKITDLTFKGSFSNIGSTEFDYKINQLSTPFIEYKDIRINGLHLWAEGGASSDLIVHMDSLEVSGVKLEPLDGMITLTKDTLNFNLGTESLLRGFNDLNINGKMFLVEDRFHVSFDNLEFVALENRWRIAEKNFIQFDKDFLYARNIRFTNEIGFVSFSTYNATGAMFTGNDIDMAIFNPFLEEQNIELKGMATFQFFVDDFIKFNQIRGTSSINNFTINDLDLGRTRLVATQDDLQSASLLELTIGEPGRDLKGRGYYKLPGIKLDEGDYRYSFDFFMDGFPVKPAEYFLTGLISETKGTFSGDFFIEGDSSIRQLGGDLTLHDASTKVDYLGTTYFVNDGSVKIDNDFIDLSKIEIKDINGNSAQVRGGINHNKLSQLNTNFRVTSPRFTILNTRKEENDLYYGRAQGRIDAQFSGPFDKLDLYVNAETGPETVVAIPLTTAKEIKEQNFIVFVNNETHKDTLSEIRKVEGLELRMDLTITPVAELQLIFDERTGDIIKGSGNGNIQLEMPRNGEFQMFGEFLIERGEYPFRLSILDKSFTVKRGGTIVWYGDPLNAYIDLEAEYKGLKTSPFNLLAEYLRDQTTNNALIQEARRPTSVDLTLKLEGQLLQPDIQFDIQLPELTGELRNYADNKLRTLASDQNEMNNVAFQLLFFKSFIPSRFDMLSSSATAGIVGSTLTEWFTGQVRVFVNEYLLDSLNNSVINDVDFDFGIVINTELTPDLEGLAAAGQSQFYLRPRFVMFEDRVILDMGVNSFGRFGDNTRIAGEFNIEYAFGDSKRFRVKVYSLGQPLPNSGMRTVFGTGLVYRREYDEFMDIFRFGKKKPDEQPVPIIPIDIDIETSVPKDPDPLEGDDK